MLTPCGYLFRMPQFILCRVLVVIYFACPNLYNVDSAKSEVDALTEAERELMMIEKDLHAAEGVIFLFLSICFLAIFLILLEAVLDFSHTILIQDKKHYETYMHDKVLSELKKEEAEYQKLEHSCKVHINS